MRQKKSNIFVTILLIAQILSAVIILSVVIGLGVEINPHLYIFLFQFLALGVPLILYLFFTNQKLSDIASFKKLSGKNIVMIVLMTILIMPSANLLSFLASLISPNTISSTVDDVYTSAGGLTTILVVALVPALFEELCMRGAVLSAYKNNRLIKAALINGLFFGMLHLSIQQFFYAFLLGMVFTFFVHHTRSILSSILAHFTFNSIQVLLLIATSDPEVEAGTAVLTTSEAVSVFIVLLFISSIFGFVFMFVYRSFAKYNMRINIERDKSEACFGEASEVEIIPESVYDSVSASETAADKSDANQPMKNNNSARISNTVEPKKERILHWSLALPIIMFAVIMICMQLLAEFSQ